MHSPSGTCVPRLSVAEDSWLILACHPLIHLAYAYELNNVEVATEALAVSCIDRDFLYKYVDAKQKYKAFSKSTSPVSQSKAILEILDMMRTDKKFDGLFESPGYWNLPILFASREETVLEYFNLFSVGRNSPFLSLSLSGLSIIWVTAARCHSIPYSRT